MHPAFRICALVALATGTAQADSGKFQPYFSSDTFLYSEPVPLASISNWQGNYTPGGEQQIGILRMKAGVSNDNWTIAGLYREDYRLNFSSDTADFYYSIENNQPIDSQRNYRLDLEAYRFRGKGIHIARHFSPHPRLQATIGANLFHASNLLDGKLSGQASATTSNSYDFQLDVDTRYAEDPLFERPLSNQPSGRGIALDARLNWQASDQLNVDIKAFDIAGGVRWENVPYTLAAANSNNVAINAQGFAQVNPILSGREGYLEHFTQSLRPSVETSFTYQPANLPYAGQAKIKYIDDTAWFGVGLHQPQQQNHWGWGINIWPQNRIAEVQLTNKNFSIALGADAIQADKLSTLWLSLSYGD